MITIKKITKKELKETIDLIYNTTIMCKTSSYYVNNNIELKNEFVESTEYSFKNKEIEFFGSFNEEKLIGVIGIEDGNYITRLYVDYKYQKLGIGKSLFYYIINNCKTNNFENIECCAVNTALEFYYKLGFKNMYNSDECISKTHTSLIFNLEREKSNDGISR